MRLWVVYTEALESPRLFQREALNSTQGQGSSTAWFPDANKADPTAKEQSCKRGTVGTKSAGGIDMILALLEGLLGGLRVCDDWFEPGRTTPCRTLSSSESLPRCTWWKPEFFLRGIQTHLDCCAWLSVAGRSCESLVPSLQSGV